MDTESRIQAFVRLGKSIDEQLKTAGDDGSPFSRLLIKVCQKNNWFTPESVQHAMQSVRKWLYEKELHEWTSNYVVSQEIRKNIGVIMAGNIPLAGFHDFLSILISGHAVQCKLSSDDPYLMPAVTEWLIAAEPAFESSVSFVARLQHFDAVIATGSNNSARYFEYYFGHCPNIIRSNRNSVAVLTGSESKVELEALGNDIFDYYGLGCRNVSKLYIPHKYNFDNFFRSIEKFSHLLNHNKYMNNYDYHNAIFLLNKVPYLTNNFLLVRENESLSTPVSVLHYSYYNNEEKLQRELENKKESIQCIVGKGYIPFGKTQQPELMDYADNKDTMQFLTKL